MKGYVYKFTSPSGKSYIGITNNLRRRIAEHKRLSKTLKKAFYNAINKYGFDNFTFEILEEYNIKDKDKLLSKLNEMEMYYIDKYDTFKNGYNSTLGGDGTKGMSGELNPFYNKKHTEEAKKKMSEKHKGKVLSNEHKNKIAKSTKEALSNLPLDKKMKMMPVPKNKKKVICLETQVIYNSTCECSDMLNISRSDIRKVCNGERIKAKNLTFRFIENGEIKEVNPTNKAKKRILCINTNKEYESITEASKELNVKHQHISAILNGRQKTTKGYSFKYI